LQTSFPGEGAGLRSNGLRVQNNGDAKDLRVRVGQIVECLAMYCRQWQHADDGEFPFNRPASADLRKKFDLPLDRPLNV
jgi:hypothetical protein